MRSKDVLFQFEDMKTLYQYLYISEEHSILITNEIGVPLRLRMNEQGVILCLNMNFPDLPELNWSENMTVKTVFSIIEQLKTVPAVEFPNRFKNRWDEVKTICLTQVSLNCK